LKNIIPTIILVKPQLPENIGLVARAMDNCGFDKLILVSPRENWPNDKAIKSAANSSIIVKNVKIFDSIDKAVSKFNYVIATSARKRFLNKPHKINFQNLFSEAINNKNIAILFGPENSGLTNKDLSLCDCIFTIPLSNKNTSLNLSHSVLLFCYQWGLLLKKFDNNIEDYNMLSNKNNFFIFMKYLRNELDNSGFLYPKEKSDSMFNNIQSMFLRAQLSEKEIKTLWGIFKILKKPKNR